MVIFTYQKARRGNVMKYLKAVWEDMAGNEVTEIRENTGDIPAIDLTVGSEVDKAEADKWIDLAQYVNDLPEYDDSPLNHVWTYSPSGEVVLP